ncbi:hypothetical protein Saga11_08880 [Bacillus safensis]|nr:hypothetical protein Saga11_08880 [Bacillus safensis]
MYQKMQEIRQFEDQVHTLFTKGILPGSYASSCKSIVDRAAGYDIPGIQVDGKDVMAVY